MSKSIEQRICIRFCLLNEINCTETMRMMRKAYGKDCLSKTRIFKWYKMFKEGRNVIENIVKSGRRRTSVQEDNIFKVNELITSNPTLTTRQLSQLVGISANSVGTILKDYLHMQRFSKGGKREYRKIKSENDNEENADFEVKEYYPVVKMEQNADQLKNENDHNYPLIIKMEKEIDLSSGYDTQCPPMIMKEKKDIQSSEQNTIEKDFEHSSLDDHNYDQNYSSPVNIKREIDSSPEQGNYFSSIREMGNYYISATQLLIHDHYYTSFFK